MMGETGPCGPCSELHVDLTPNGDTKGSLVNKDSDLCIEIWNLVFIQYNAEADGSFRDLPAKHVDTGMGFERACSIIQNTKGLTDFSEKPTNYATDVFQPIFRKLEELSGKIYFDIYSESEIHSRASLEQAIAFRVIADHIRTLLLYRRWHPPRQHRPQLCPPPHPPPRRQVRPQPRLRRRRTFSPKTGGYTRRSVWRHFP